MVGKMWVPEADRKPQSPKSGSSQQPPSYGTTPTPTPSPRKAPRIFIRNPTATSTIPTPEEAGLGHRVRQPQNAWDTQESERSPAFSSIQTEGGEQTQPQVATAPNDQAPIPSSSMVPNGAGTPSMDDTTGNPGNLPGPRKISRRNSMATIRANDTEATETQPLLRRKSNPTLGTLNHNDQPTDINLIEVRLRKRGNRAHHSIKVNGQTIHTHVEEGFQVAPERGLWIRFRRNTCLVVLMAFLAAALVVYLFTIWMFLRNVTTLRSAEIDPSNLTEGTPDWKDWTDWTESVSHPIWAEKVTEDTPGFTEDDGWTDPVCVEEWFPKERSTYTHKTADCSPGNREACDRLSVQTFQEPKLKVCCTMWQKNPRVSWRECNSFA